MRNAPSLLAQARNQANEEHNRRMAELTALAPLLEKLDAYVPQLEAQGLRFYTHNMGLRTARLEPDARRVYKVLRLWTDGHSLSEKANTSAKWFKAFTALGFKPIKAEEGICPNVTLRNGSFLVCVDAHADWLHEAKQVLKPATTREAA